MTPRFFFDEPRPASVADRLLADAHSVELRLMKNDRGNVNLLFEVKGNVGADSWLDDADEVDSADEARESHAALAFARQIVCAFAAAGKAGDA